MSKRSGGSGLTGSTGHGEGGSSEERSRQLDEIRDLKKDWDLMRETDTGTAVDPAVREIHDFIEAYLESDGTGEFPYYFVKNGELIKWLNGYQINTGDYGHDVHVLQAADLHSVYVTRQGMLSFMRYMKERWKGYIDWAKQESSRG